MKQENNVHELLNKIRKIKKVTKQDSSYKNLSKQGKIVHRTIDEEIKYIIQEEEKHRVTRDV